MSKIIHKDLSTYKQNMKDWEHRFDNIRLLELEISLLPPHKVLSFHQQLRFYDCLLDKERLQLKKIFPNELCLAPLRSETLKAQRQLWDSKARLYLRSFLDFREEIEKQNMTLISMILPDDPVNILAITSSGSLVSAGLPDMCGIRKIIYKPLRNTDVHSLSEQGRIKGLLQTGLKAMVGRVRLSKISYLAISTEESCRFESLGLLRRSDPGSFVLSKTLTKQTPNPCEDYIILRDLLKTCQNDSDRQALECELLGAALHIQSSMDPQKLPLKEIDHIVCSQGTVYHIVVEKKANCPGEELVHLVRTKKHQKPRTFKNISIGPQQISEGAPLVFFDRESEHDQRIVCCTEPILSYQKRGNLNTPEPESPDSH